MFIDTAKSLKSILQRKAISISLILCYTNYLPTDYVVKFLHVYNTYILLLPLLRYFIL